jgi:hypothetical protein
VTERGRVAPDPTILCGAAHDRVGRPGVRTRLRTAFSSTPMSWGYPLFSSGLAPGDRHFHQVPGLVPADPRDLTGAGGAVSQSTSMATRSNCAVTRDAVPPTAGPPGPPVA